MRTRSFALVFCTLSLVACERTADPVNDAGPAPDGGPSDRVAPTIRETAPADGDEGVARDAELVVRFSEPMDGEVGSVRIAPGGTVLSAASGEWDEAGNVLTLRPTSPWPAGEVTLTFEADFRDLAGNALEESSIDFTTVDDIAPRVVETTPAEGATGVSARLDAIVVRFDEPMRATEGTLDVLGGSATLGAPEWSADGTTVTFPVADLEYEREYDVTLRGFVDVSGNRFDESPYVEDGVLDFSTGADEDSPRVLRAEPTEGQVDVNPADASAILVTFDEVMDTSVSEVTLSDGTESSTLTGTWTGSGRIFRVETAGLLAFDATYALDLRGLRDRAGNAVDPVTYLADGRLDFTVGLDAFMPFVRASSPAEGEIDVSYAETSEVSLSFSEAMDTSITTVTLSGGPAPVEVEGTWISDTELVLDVAGRLSPGATMTLDLTAMRDTRGNALDATHRYLADGRLDFSTGAPIGEGCADPLTIAEATLMDGAYTWSVTSRQGAVRDGGNAYCDHSATSANGTDVLIRYEKTSDAASAGGRYLRVVLDGSTGTSTGTNAFDMAVASGATCDPTAIPAVCRSNQAFQQIDIDLAAGPVWIWVSRTTSSTTTVSATVTVTEVEPPAVEGESCDAPFTSASPIYAPPSGTGATHTFTIPRNSLRSIDIGPYSNVAPNLFSCDTALGHGIDGVVRFDKPDDTSVLRVSARRTDGSDSFNLEVFDGCDASSATSLGCRTGVTTTAQELLVDAPAGPVYVWVGDTLTTVSRSSSEWQYNPEITLDVEVIPDVGTGEICSRAHEAAVGANAVAGTSDLRLNPPSCFGDASPVEWYRLRTTQDVLFVSADAAGGLALLDPASAGEIACVPDGQARTLTRVLPVGTDVCIAVEVGRGITSLQVSGQAYDGLGSTPPVDLNILRPLSTSGTSEESATSDYWMVVNDSTLMMRHTFSAIMDVSRTGNERAVRRGTDDGIVTSTSGTSIQNVGRTAVAVDGALFTFNTSTGTTGFRVHRMWDGRSPFWSPISWDVGATYGSDEIQAAARDGSTSNILYVTDNGPTVFYRISTVGPSTPQVVGTSMLLDDVRGMVADDQFVYVVATVDSERGVWRIPRADVGAEPFALARTTSFSTSTTQATAMEVDSLTAPRNLYVRNAAGEVEAIIDPAGASPFYLGPVIERGRSGDFAMTLDHATGELFLFETETVSTGTWLRYDP